MDTSVITFQQLTDKGVIFKASYDFPNPLFDVYYSSYADRMCLLSNKSVCYIIFGFNKITEQYETYIGETGNTFKNRFVSSHEKKPWFKDLDTNTVLFMVVDVADEHSIDFRKALEHSLSVLVEGEGLNPINLFMSEAKVSRVMSFKKIQAISMNVVELLKNLRNVSDTTAPSSTMSETKTESVVSSSEAVGVITDAMSAGDYIKQVREFLVSKGGVLRSVEYLVSKKSGLVLGENPVLTVNNSVEGQQLTYVSTRKLGVSGYFKLDEEHNVFLKTHGSRKDLFRRFSQLVRELDSI